MNGATFRYRGNGRRAILPVALACVALAAPGCGGKRTIASRPPTTTSPTPSPGPAPTARPPGTRPAPSTLPPATPGSFFEEGQASWYGVPYHGRRSSNGEVYDMHQKTAAHRTLPFETIVRVTNMKNGRKTEVRITDRGPFVEGRVIDLSLGAAKEIDMVGAGIAGVRLELLSGPHPTAGQFTVQIGAFSQRQNAVRLRQNLERKYQPVLVSESATQKGLLYRVRVGRLTTEAAAQRLADKLRREENITPTYILRLDE